MDVDGIISRGEVEKAIKELKAGKAAGCDGVVNELLKYGGEGSRVSLEHAEKVLR